VCLTVATLLTSPEALRAQTVAPPLNAMASVAPPATSLAAAQAAQSQTRMRPALRGRWGAAFGLMRFGGHGSFDYTNSATPFLAVTGPYPGAVIDIDHVGRGILFSGGYRGPFHEGGRVGFGIDAEFGGGGGHPADKTVTVSTPRGVVRFSTDDGGVIDLVTAGGSGHVSFNVAPRLNVLAGVKMSALRVKPAFGSYDGPRPPTPPGATQPGNFFLAAQGDRSPKFWRSEAVPFVGAELFFWEHGSIDVAAAFEPEKTERLATTPWVFTFGRDRAWVSASVRIFR